MSKPHAKSDAFDWLLSSFEVTDALELIPVPKAPPWETALYLAKKFEARYVLGILPLFWQLQQRLHYALRKERVPLLALPPEQGRAALALLAQVPVRGVVLPRKDFLALGAELARARPGIYFQVILKPGEEPASTELPNVFYESHAAPGSGVTPHYTLV